MASDLMEDIAPGLHCYIKKKKWDSGGNNMKLFSGVYFQ